jgi:hypothetical protein
VNVNVARRGIALLHRRFRAFVKLKKEDRERLTNVKSRFFESFSLLRRGKVAISLPGLTLLHRLFNDWTAWKAGKRGKESPLSNSFPTPLDEQSEPAAAWRSRVVASEPG